MSTIKDQIKADLVAAMKAKEQTKVETIRLINAAIKQREVDERIVLDDAQVLSVLQKMLKQRRDSIEQFVGANRHDLADKEKAEVALIEVYLPAQLSAAEVDAAIQAAIASAGAKTAADMGKVMGVLKPQLQGKADLTAVSAKVKVLLQ